MKSDSVTVDSSFKLQHLRFYTDKSKTEREQRQKGMLHS